MRDAGLEEAQAGIKIAGRNIKNLRYADDTTLMAYHRSHGPLQLHASNATVFPKALNSLYLLVIRQKIQKGGKNAKTEEPSFDKGAGKTSPMAEGKLP